MQNFFPQIDLEYYVFLHLTKNSKSDVDERGHRLRFFHTHAGFADLHDLNKSFTESEVSEQISRAKYAKIAKGCLAHRDPK